MSNCCACGEKIADLEATVAALAGTVTDLNAEIQERRQPTARASFPASVLKPDSWIKFEDGKLFIEAAKTSDV